MWVDILPSTEANSIPEYDIRLPTQRQFEIRLIIWETRNIPSDDPNDPNIDMYCKARLTGSDDWQTTDTHLRAKKGIGSFNYRMKFPVMLPPKPSDVDGWGCLFLQIYDFDLLSANDLLFTREVNISYALRAASELYADGKGDKSLFPFKITRWNGKGGQHDWNSMFKQYEAMLRKKDPVHQADEVRKQAEAQARKKLEQANRLLKTFTGNSDDSCWPPHEQGSSQCFPGGQGGRSKPPRRSKPPSGARSRVSTCTEIDEDDQRGGQGYLLTEQKEKESLEKLTPFELQRWANKQEGKAFKHLSKERQHLLERSEYWDKLKSKWDIDWDNDPTRFTVLKTELATESTRLLSQKKLRSKKHTKKDSQELASGLKDLVGAGDNAFGSMWVDGEAPKIEAREPKTEKKESCWGRCSCCGKGADGDSQGKPQMLISIEVLPQEMADNEFPAGLGRSDPNTNPVLPPPKGRIQIGQLFNPFYIISLLCGETIAKELACFLCCLVFLAVMIYVGPLILDTAIFALELPSGFGAMLGVFFAAAFMCVIYQVYTTCRDMCCPQRGAKGYDAIADGDEG